MADEQVGTIVESLVLPDDWLDAALERLSMRDEVARVKAERERLTEKLRRLTKAYIDCQVDEPDYERFKAQYEFELASLVVPEADAVAEAGRLLQQLPELWRLADLSERRRLLLSILDAVYVDLRKPDSPIGIRPKAAFEAVLGTLAMQAANLSQKRRSHRSRVFTHPIDGNTAAARDFGMMVLDRRGVAEKPSTNGRRSEGLVGGANG